MALRPVFIPDTNVAGLVDLKNVDFTWFPGFAASQKAKSLESLHLAARNLGHSPLLEVSSKSQSGLGRSLSAFNLMTDVPEVGLIPLESAFQGSKVFLNSGSCHDLYQVDPRSAKNAARKRDQGDLQGFEFGDRRWELEPKTAFYDWLYVRALMGLPTNALNDLTVFSGFTDIEFNPTRSFNCQARSCAVAVALLQLGQLDSAMATEEQFLTLVFREAFEPDDSSSSSFIQSSLI